MNITYNGVSTSNKLLTFSEVPNILKLSENITGRYGIINFIINQPFSNTVTGDGQYYITFLDETITNVMNPKDANNKRFYIASDVSSTVASIGLALRNCGSLAAQFTIEFGGDEVELRAKTLGQKWLNHAHYLDTNIPSSYLTVEGNGDGTAYPADVYMSKVLVQVYGGGKFLTTLEKIFYGDECAFDMSPVLSTFTEFGKTTDYRFWVSTIAQNGTWVNRGQLSGATCYGYQANQSDNFEYLNNNYIALNTNRNQLRYVYGNTIPFTVIGTGSSVSVSYVIKNAAKSQIYSDTSSVSIADGYIQDTEFTIPSNIYTLASYVDITVGSKTARFKVIKPLNATEYYQRVLWRNEYGGIEFFDFTGQRSESDTVDIETYEKNIFDMYENHEYEIKKIYDNDYKKEVKLTSHLLEADGRWFANSLMRSKKVWTTINSKKHYIIPKNIDVQEDSTYNNIYTVSLTYEYSQLS